MPTPPLAAAPPGSPQLLPTQVYTPLTTIFSWFLWFGTFFCVASFIATVMMLVWQRRSQASTHLFEESTLIRILIAAAVLGSASVTADALLSR